MAKLKNGILGPLIGKLANLVGYERLGQPVVRMVPRPTKKKKPRSDGQKAVNLRFKIVKAFISRIGEFVNVGFRLDVAGTTKIPENGAVSYNLKHAVVGEYPDLAIDYSKVLVCRGKLPGPVNATVELDGDLLKFKWDVDPAWSKKLKRDQVMMLAYVPATDHASYWLSGARRAAGADELEAPRAFKARGVVVENQFIETYIAFISDDRQSISDSVYVGRVMV